jgi:hypothetical protein
MRVDRRIGSSLPASRFMQLYPTAMPSSPFSMILHRRARQSRRRLRLHSRNSRSISPLRLQRLHVSLQFIYGLDEAQPLPYREAIAQPSSGFLKRSRIRRIAGTARPGFNAIVSAMNSSADFASMLRAERILI